MQWILLGVSLHEFSSEERPYENDEEEAENVAQKEENLYRLHIWTLIGWNILKQILNQLWSISALWK